MIDLDELRKAAEKATGYGTAWEDRRSAIDFETLAKPAVVLAMIEEIEKLREALIEAREDIVHWAGYASDYFKDKHDYAGDLARIDVVLEAKP